MMRPIVILAILLVAVGCKRESVNRFDDPDHLRIADFQDRRSGDSLVPYLHHPLPELRRQAALAFASLQDTVFAGEVGSLLLEDPDQGVRAAAAFALGQTGGYQALNALIPGTEDGSAPVRAEALEALGKIASRADVQPLTRKGAHDSLTIGGQAWGIYRAGLRGVVDTAMVNAARSTLELARHPSAQLACAHFFNRATYPMLRGIQESLGRTIRSWDPDIRMAATGALRKFNNENMLRVLTNLLDGEDHYRVRVQAMRAVGNTPWAQAEKFLAAGLKDPNANVAIAAAEVIRGMASQENLSVIRRWAEEAGNARTQALLYEAILSVDPGDASTKQVTERYQSTRDDYQKAWLLGALSKSFQASTFIVDEMLRSHAEVVKSSAAEALVRMNGGKEFPPGLKDAFADHMRRGVEDGDPGVIVHLCSALRDSTLGYRETLTDLGFLHRAREKLSMPRDYEIIQPLAETIAYLEGAPAPSPIKNEFNRPINWELAKSIPADQQVAVETTRGTIVIQLHINEAPGSVINFVELINRKYYDGKYFHRVVPNFVIQTGCHRGDGFGNEDYSIRSEFSTRRYKTGSVGMASAGKDTEGTQWFITHSPTPHLDGRYTIFAEVITGMEVVHLIEVGDRISSVRLLAK